jgi:hypothetical protein
MKTLKLKIMKKKIIIAGLIILACSACSTDEGAYRNAALPVEQRVNSLIRQMTQEEKVDD